MKQAWCLNMEKKKALFISFPDHGTDHDLDNKIFTNAHEALEVYRRFKKITKYKVMVMKAWAIPCKYHQGFTWQPR